MNKNVIGSPFDYFEGMLLEIRHYMYNWDIDLITTVTCWKAKEFGKMEKCFTNVTSLKHGKLDITMILEELENGRTMLFLTHKSFFILFFFKRKTPFLFLKE